MPPEFINAERVLMCDMSMDVVPGLLGVDNCYAEEVGQKTGIDVRVQEVLEAQSEEGAQHSTLIFEGPVLQVYAAHPMFMRRYHEEEERKYAEAEAQDEAAEDGALSLYQHEDQSEVEGLKKKLEELQRQMDELKHASTQEKGGKGKGKGKGKTKKN